MVILVNYKDNYDTATTAANKSMGFDLGAIHSCLTPFCMWEKEGGGDII